MKKQVLFIHSAGSQGRNKGSWKLFEYLKNSLGDGYEVLFPKMPEPENPRYVPWKEMLREEFASLEGSVILVGHSLGSSVLLKYLSEERCSNEIAGLFLVASPFWGVQDWEIDEFILKSDFASALPFIPKIYLYHSSEDEWVPFKHLRYYAQKLPEAHIRVVEGDEHEFYYGLPELAEDIKNL